jgi:hypothetical protein
MTEKRSASAWLALALLWAVVAIPAEVVAKSMALFR